MKTRLGPIELRSPLIAASGTVGSVWEWAAIADTEYYGAAVAKSVSLTPWTGRGAPRLAPTRAGMLNGIGIQNPGIESWVASMEQAIGRSDVPIWGSAVGRDPAEFAEVAAKMASVGVMVVEVNLSCPNLEDSNNMFSFDAGSAASVVAAAAERTDIPLGAKLSPNTPDIVGVSKACLEAGATFLTLTNTALGFGVAAESRRPLLSGGVGGYSGPGLKPLALRCVFEVARALPQAAIVGCGGISTGRDVIEYLIAGASAVEIGTVHLAEPRAGRRIAKEMQREIRRLGISTLSELVGSVDKW